MKYKGCKIVQKSLFNLSLGSFISFGHCHDKPWTRSFVKREAINLAGIDGATTWLEL